MKKDSNEKKINQDWKLQLLVLLACPKYIIPFAYDLSQLAYGIEDPAQNKK